MLGTTGTTGSPPPTAPLLSGVLLVETATNTVIRTILPGDNIILPDNGYNIIVEPNADPNAAIETKAVHFTLIGPTEPGTQVLERRHREATAPFALFSDSGGNYNDWADDQAGYIFFEMKLLNL
jgi:hypothetical protein